MKSQLSKIFKITFIILIITLSKSYSIEIVTEFTDAINKTREEYARKDDVKDDVHEIMDAMRRLEDKLDKILMGNK